MEEKEKDKPMRWSIRLTFEQPDGCSNWTASQLMLAVLNMINTPGEFKEAKCTRLTVDQDDY
jgi:hypothetical protein